MFIDGTALAACPGSRSLSPVSRPLGFWRHRAVALRDPSAARSPCGSVATPGPFRTAAVSVGPTARPSAVSSAALLGRAGAVAEAASRSRRSGGSGLAGGLLGRRPGWWTRNERTRTLVALPLEERLAGVAAALRVKGWSDHAIVLSWLPSRADNGLRVQARVITTSSTSVPLSPCPSVPRCHSCPTFQHHASGI